MLPVKKWSRYINNKLLECIQRPQPYNFCAISSIQEILLYFDINISCHDILDKTNIKKERVESGSIGNSTICQALKTFDIQSYFVHNLLWNDITTLIHNNKPIIYHRPGHYSLVVGYCEEPLIHNNGLHVKYNAEKTVGWLIVADHRVKNATTKERGMLEMIKWTSAKKMIDKKNIYGFIVIDNN